MINLDFENVMQGVGMGSESCFLKSLKENVTSCHFWKPLHTRREKEKEKNKREKSVNAFLKKNISIFMVIQGSNWIAVHNQSFLFTLSFIICVFFSLLCVCGQCFALCLEILESIWY